MDFVIFLACLVILVLLTIGALQYFSDNPEDYAHVQQFTPNLETHLNGEPVPLGGDARTLLASNLSEVGMWACWLTGARCMFQRLGKDEVVLVYQSASGRSTLKAAIGNTIRYNEVSTHFEIVD